MKKSYSKHIDFIGSNGIPYRAGLRNGMDIVWEFGPEVAPGYPPTLPPVPKMQKLTPPPDVNLGPAAKATAVPANRHQSGHKTNQPRLIRQPHYTTQRMYSGEGTQPAEAHFHTPVGFQNLETHVKVPAMLAFIVSVPIAILGGLASGHFGYNPFLAAFIIFWLSFVIVALWRVFAGDKQLVQRESYKNDSVFEAVEEEEDAQRQIPIPSHGGAVMVTDNNRSGHPSEDDWKRFGKAMAHPRYFDRNEAWSRNKLRKETHNAVTQGVFNRCFAYLKKNNMLGKEDWRKRSRLNQMGWKYIGAYLPHPEGEGS